ncbi:MAG TPA: adenosylcobinamide-GDP ribazoletransferase [Methanocorpusculum sp.]|nr:adenosylcobinamide-GDP ribazoletransferase [Methanocorpusculum sp.]
MKPGIIYSICALLQFTTIFPLGKPVDFDNFAKRSWLFPISGYVIGSFAALPALIAWFFEFENSFIIAAVTIALTVFISGANHFDGLLDFGDGIMAHGSREKRITALTDRITGSGALAMGIFVVLISFAALSSLPVISISIAVICAEVFGKMSMGLSSALGRPFHDGIHKYIYDLSKRRFAVYTVILALPLLFITPFRTEIIVSFICAILVFILMLITAKKLFGGVNGDVTGASCEIVKMVVFAVFSVIAAV